MPDVSIPFGMTELPPEPRLDRKHGSPYDRGSADAYYHRHRHPHYFRGASYMSEEIPESAMTPAQLAEYHAGFDEQDERKDWGRWDEPESPPDESESEPDDDEPEDDETDATGD